MVDYQKPAKGKPNKESKEEDEPKIEKIVTGEVITRKRPLGAKVKEVFFGGDVHAVAQYLAAEVLLPAARNLIVEFATEGVKKIVYGDSAPKGSRPGYSPHLTYGSSSSYVPYNKYSGSRPMQPTGYRAARSRRSFEEVILGTRRDAQHVLDTMQDILDRHERVSVADLKTLAGIRTEPQDNEWGWVYLADAEIRQVREGYLIRLHSPDVIEEYR